MSRAVRGSQRGAKVAAAAKAKVTAAGKAKTKAKPEAGKAKVAVKPEAKAQMTAAVKGAKPKVAKGAKPRVRAATVAKVAKGEKSREGRVAKAATGGQGGARVKAAAAGLPEVVVRSGRLAVADPVAAAGVILERPIAEGEYAVELTLAEGRPAALVARLGAGAVARWDVVARVDLEAGVVALADRDAFAAIAAEAGGFPTPSFRAIERQLLEEHYAGGWGWASYQPERQGSCVAIVFDAAAAEVAWGLDDAGEAVALRLTPAP
jgi:hypothetical protein